MKTPELKVHPQFQKMLREQGLNLSDEDARKVELVFARMKGNNGVPEPAHSSEGSVRSSGMGRPLEETPRAEVQPEIDDAENIALGAAEVMRERQTTPGFTPKAVWLQRRLRWGWIRASRLLAEIVRRSDEGERPTDQDQAPQGSGA